MKKEIILDKYYKYLLNHWAKQKRQCNYNKKIIQNVDIYYMHLDMKIKGINVQLFVNLD